MPFFYDGPTTYIGIPTNTPKNVETTNRPKRQVMSVVPNKQFVDDFYYRSVDMNQDGLPDSPFYYPYTMPTSTYAAPAPLVAFVPMTGKTTFKTVTAEANPSAKTPANTNKFDLKEKSFDVVTPFTYPAAVPYTYPFFPTVATAAVAATTPIKVESSRKKRQATWMNYNTLPFPYTTTYGNMYTMNTYTPNYNGVNRIVYV